MSALGTNSTRGKVSKPMKLRSTRGADVTALVNQSVSVHAAVADHCETFFV